MGDAITIENLSLEEVTLTKHRKERKELQAKIQALKKTADKGDKKKKREILDEIIKLEFNLNKKQAEELDNIKENKSIDEAIQNNDCPSLKAANEGTDQQQQQQRVSKAQKRRDKKAQAEKEKLAEILVQDEINKTGPRMIEIKTLKSILKSRNLVLHPIASDGDCLYNAIKHQLEVITGKTQDTQTLRQLTADYIFDNKDSLIFYMTNPSNGDCLTDTEFTKYCEAVRNTPAWGGQIEIKALSQVLRVPIEVLQATGPPTIQNEDNFCGPNLVITYHRFMYSLGEHYNSTKPITEGFNDDDETAENDVNGE